MPGYNSPYRGMYGNNPGFGSNFSYGQQGGNNPYGQAQRGSANYGQSYQGSSQGYPGGGQRDVGSPNYWDRPNQGWGDQWSRDGGGGYPGQQQRMPQPPAGKGRGMGGISGGFQSGGMPGGGSRGGGGYRTNDPFQQMDPWNRQMMYHERLLQQRQMEEALGVEQGWSWYEPTGMKVPSYGRPGGQQETTDWDRSGLYGPYGDRGR